MINRVLFINGGIMHQGGIESFMMNYYRNLDRSKIQIDFVVHGYEKGAYDDEIESLGGKIYRVPVKSKDLLGNIKELRKIFLNNEYKIVHSHMDAMSSFVLKLAKSCGIPIRIAHSHNTNHLTNNPIKYLINEVARFQVRKYATHFFACSTPAAIWLFGMKNLNCNKVTIVRNGIDFDKYKFDQNKRDKIREMYDFNETDFIIGHIGRFDYQKNHSFIINLFNKFKKEDRNARLFLIGDGKLLNKTKRRVRNLKIEDYVLFSGSVNNVDELLNAFDVFILPSRFEGLGIVLIEAQVNGLSCLASTEVPNEVNISNQVYFIELGNRNEVNWLNILHNVSVNRIRNMSDDLLLDSGYSIKQEAKKLQQLYLDYLEGEK